MQRTILTVNGEKFPLAESQDIAKLTRKILRVSHHHARFVDVDVADGRKTRVLIGPCSSVQFDTLELRDPVPLAREWSHAYFDDLL